MVYQIFMTVSYFSYLLKNESSYLDLTSTAFKSLILTSYVKHAASKKLASFAFEGYRYILHNSDCASFLI